MAELQDFITSLEKELTCSICEDIFQDPKTLQCLHSFCSKCIEKWIETCKNRKQRLTCPTCRSREDGDISKLRNSFYLDSLKQLLLARRNKAQNEKGDKSESMECCCCEKLVQLVAFCSQCEGLICHDCLSAHSAMKHLRHQHQVIKLSDFKQEHVSSFVTNQWHCQEKFHEKNKLEYYCKTCDSYICQKCTAISHTIHDKISIEEKVEEVKHLINDNLNRVNQSKQSFVQELQMSKDNIFRLEKEIKAAKKEVSAHVRAQIKILQDHENTMLTTLDERLLKLKASHEEDQREIKAVIEEFDAVIEKGAHDQKVDYIILQSQVPQKCQKLLQIPSVLKSKPKKLDTSICFIPNTQIIQDFDVGKIEESFADPSRCTVQLLNDIVRCGFVNKFEIETRNAEGQICHTDKAFIDVKIKDEDGCQVESELAEIEKGRFVISYKAMKPALDEIIVCVGGRKINGSSIKVKTVHERSDFVPYKILENMGDIEPCSPRSVAINDNTEQIVVYRISHRVLIFTIDGKYLRELGSGTGNKDGQFFSPRGVVSYENKVLVGDHPHESGRIQEFYVNGEYHRTIYKQTNIELFGMCVTDTNIAVCWKHMVDKTQSGIKLFNKQYGFLDKDIPFNNKVIERLPRFVAYNNDRYFVTFLFLDHIEVYDEDGNLLYKFGNQGKRPGYLLGPQGIAIYGSNMLLVCDGDNHRVQVFSQEGDFITTFGSYGSDMGKMNDPIDVDVTPDGKVLVAEWGGSRIHVWK